MIKRILTILLMSLFITIPVIGNINNQKVKAEENISQTVPVSWGGETEPTNNIMVYLMDRGQRIDELYLNSDNNWSGEFTDVKDGYYVTCGYCADPAYKDYMLQFKRITKAYSCRNIDAEGSIETGFLIKPSDNYTDIKGNITWDDTDESNRPESVKVNLLKDDETIDSKIVTADDNWFYDFGHYPVQYLFPNLELDSFKITVDKITDYYSVAEGYDTVLTPETKITLTKELKGQSEEEEFGVYIIPFHKTTSLWIQKIQRRYPRGFYSFILYGAQRAIKQSKIYDETSEKEPIYPLISKLFDEEWIDKKIDEIEKYTEENDYYDDSNFSEEEAEKLKTIVAFLLNENKLNGNEIQNDEDNHDPDTFDNPHRRDQAFRTGFYWLGAKDNELSELLSCGFDSFEEFVDTRIRNNVYFYTTIKAGETKTINIPAKELVSLTILETDYGDTEEFETIYWNKPSLDYGLMYGDISMIDYMQDGSDQARSEFEYTLTNIGQVIPTQIALTGKKELTGKALSDNQFSFVLKEDDSVIDEATCDAQGNISFKEIEYTEEGEHVYTIEEKNDNQAGYEYDTHIETVKVNVTKDDDYNLVATPEYDSDGVIFTNKYNATGSVVLEVTKSLAGKEITNNQFAFELKDGDNVISTAKNKDGKIIFDAINYTEADAGKEFTYTISEVDENVPGYTYDSHTATAKVTVTDNGDGSLTATPQYTDAEFTNTYTASGSIVLEATKSLTGRSLEDEQFSFELKEGDDVIATATNKNGKVIFEAIEYSTEDIGKEFTYTIVETDDSKSGYEYDTHTATVKVKVEDNGDGTLKVTPTYTDNEFVNVYTANGSVELEAAKVLNGRMLEDGQFTFELKAGDVTISTTTNKDGKITFAPINYTIEDAGKEFNYTITEVNDNKPGYIYDEHTATVKVNVTDNGDGTLTATPAYTDEIFTNKYDATGSITFNGIKKMEGADMSEFTFILKDEAGNEYTAKNDAEENFTFETINYTLADIGKTFIYKITEFNDSKENIIYDEHEEVITVTVEDAGDGTLKLTPVYDEDGIVFINKYKEPVIPEEPVEPSEPSDEPTEEVTEEDVTPQPSEAPEEPVEIIEDIPHTVETSVDTGDTNPTVPLAVVGASALGLLIATLGIRRRRNR